jgi:branched-subunit amino acid ABC-type transport system permease component
MSFTALQFTLIGIGVVGMFGVHLLLRRTQLGRAMRATAADASLASGVGINVRRNTTITWAVSGLFCGLGGVALAINTAAFSPTTGDGFVFIVFAAAVVGGLGQPYGAMLGGLVIGIATEEFAIYSPPLEYVMAFALLIAVLLFRPGGLVRIGGRARRDSALT